jgi:hypothetical protein
VRVLWQRPPPPRRPRAPSGAASSSSSPGMGRFFPLRLLQIRHGSAAAKATTTSPPLAAATTSSPWDLQGWLPCISRMAAV